MPWVVLCIALIVLLAEAVAVAIVVRRKQLDKWLPSYLFGMSSCARLNQPQPSPDESAELPSTICATVGSRAETGWGITEFGDDKIERVERVSGHRSPFDRMRHNEELHVLIAVCDHYEPDNARPSRHVADERVARWCRSYPQLFGHFSDSRGRAPQHSFFYPQDEYFVPHYLDQLKGLCSAGFGDVEIHLHHDNDTEDQLREKLETFRDTLVNRHGLLRRDRRRDDLRIHPRQLGVV